MKDEIVMTILREMTPLLSQEQLDTLKEVIRAQLSGYEVQKRETSLMRTDQNGMNYLQVFLESSGIMENLKER